MQISNDIKVLLSITNDAIHPEREGKSDYNGTDFNNLYEMARKNHILAVLFPAIEKMKKTDAVPDEIYRYWRNTTKGRTIGQYQKYYAIRKILEESKKQNVTLVFFKGCVLAEVYPQYVLRYSGDTDIFIYKEDREQVSCLLNSLGYIEDMVTSKEQVRVFTNEQYSHIIELHTSLYEDYSGPKIELLEEMHLTDRDSLIQEEACGMELTTLGYTEHLIYQFFHIIKHFTIQGVTMRYLIDITLFVNRYKDQIDLKRFWQSMEKLGYTDFVISYFWICIKYLGLTKDILLDQSNEPKNVESLLVDLVAVGSVYDEHSAGWQLLGIMTPYLVGEEGYSKSKFIRKIRIIFPSSKSISEDYSYAKKHKILLPIAWVHRDILFLYRKHKNKNEWYAASEKLKVAERRINLMSGLGLIEQK